MLAPLLVLLGLRSGAVEGMRAAVLRDPLAREVLSLTSGSYDGNVRELQSLIERCVILSGLDGLPTAAADAERRCPGELPDELPDLRTAELRYIEKVYEAAGGNVNRACAILGINRSTLWRKMKGRQ